MVLDLNKLPNETREWLDQRARRRGTSSDAEAVDLLESAIQERIRRERLFEAAARARVRVSGPPVTAEEIEEAINWGRE